MTSKLSAHIVVGIVAAITLTVLSFAAAALILYILWTSITVQWLLVLRISIVVGVVSAVLFIFAEGKSIVDGYLREVRK